MAKQTSSVDVVIKAHDKASKKFAAIGRTFTMMTGKVFAFGLKKIGSMFTSMISRIIAGLKRLVKYAAVSFAAILSYSTYAAIKQEDADIRLAAALKSTGYAAGLSSKQLKKYAGELQNVSTYGDEAIQGAMSLLATFKDIKGDVFKKATVTILDMSEALGQDLKSSTIQLGKALNDPAKGITALSRVGVSFTDKQKKMIVGFIKVNDVISAQKVILKELNSEFGGMASAIVRTTGGALKQLKNTMGDIAETIGKASLPFLQKSSTKMKEWLEKNNELIGKWAQKIYAVMEFVTDIFIDFIKYMKTDWQDGLTFVWDSFLEIMGAAMKSAVAIAIAGGRAAGEGFSKYFTEGLLGKDMPGVLRRMREIANRGAKLGVADPRGEYALYAPGGGYSEYGEKVRLRAIREMDREQVESWINPVIESVKHSFVEAGKNIAAKTPPALWAGFTASYEKFMAAWAAAGKSKQNPLKAIADILGQAFQNAFGGAVNAFGWLGTIGDRTGGDATGRRRGLSPTQSRFLTMAPGTRLGPEERTEKNTAKTAKSLKELLRDIKTLIRNTDPYRTAAAVLPMVVL